MLLCDRWNKDESCCNWQTISVRFVLTFERCLSVILRYVVSIPFGHTQREADGVGEKNRIYRGQSKCITWYSKNNLFYNNCVTNAQKCVLSIGDKRRNVDLESVLNVPSIPVLPAHFRPHLLWLKCDGFHPPFLERVGHFYIKYPDFVFAFMMYLYECYGSALDAIHD